MHHYSWDFCCSESERRTACQQSVCMDSLEMSERFLWIVDPAGCAAGGSDDKRVRVVGRLLADGPQNVVDASNNYGLPDVWGHSKYNQKLM